MILPRRLWTVRALQARAAAPEGGALHWVRGCAIILSIFGTVSSAQDLPSRQSVELYEILLDKVGGEDWIRFRFVAPEIARDGGRLSFVEAEPDMAVLCETVALPHLAGTAGKADKIAISLSDRPTEFGVPSPEATQFVEIYRPENGRCIWEAF